MVGTPLRNQRWTGRTVTVPVLVVAAATLTACGGSSATATGTASPTRGVVGDHAAPSASSAAATRTGAAAGATPPGPYIAVVNGNEIDFYDPSAGTKLSSRPVSFDFYRMSGMPGGVAPGGVRGSFTAQSNDVNGSPYAFDGDFTRLAGLDSYPGGGDTVPAYLDLTTGTVTDVVTPTDHTGFAKTDPVTYDRALYNPVNGDLWALQDTSTGGVSYDSHRFTLTGPAGANGQYVCTNLFTGPPGLAFGVGASRPAVVSDCNLTPAEPPVPDDALYLPFDAVGQTDFQVGNIRRPDSGQPGGAFLAQPPNGGQPVLMVWDGSTTPRQLAVVPKAEAQSGDTGVVFQVVRFKDA